MAECDWAGNRGQAGVASLRPDPDLDLDLRGSTSHRSAVALYLVYLLYRTARLYCRWAHLTSQHGTAQLSSAQHSTAQHSTVAIDSVCATASTQCIPPGYIVLVIYFASYDPDCVQGPATVRGVSKKHSHPSLPSCPFTLPPCRPASLPIPPFPTVTPVNLSTARTITVSGRVLWW